MYSVAWKMLVGDRAKYLGIIMGLTFASLLITQQSSIFNGLMTRTFGAISDLGLPDVWAMDPKVQFIDDVKPLQDTQLTRVRGVEGVRWAVPLYKGLLKAKLENGNFQNCIVLGLDDASLVGGPPVMVEGSLDDLRISDGVIVDEVGAHDKLASIGPNGERVPLKVGDVLELNDNRAVVVGICKTSRTFQSQPVVYTTYTRATSFAPAERKLLSFVLVKAEDGMDHQELADRITQATNFQLKAYTRQGFKDLTYDYYMKYTGIPINFGIAVALGFFIGTAIAGQTFYNFTLENLRYFGTLKAMGAHNRMLLKMILLQSTVVGVLGWGLGVGLASLFGLLTKGSELSFLMTWRLLGLSGGAIAFICMASALVSIRKVMKLEPAVVFRS